MSVLNRCRVPGPLRAAYLGAALVMAALPATRADEAPQLSSNPFERPAWLSQAREIPTVAPAPRPQLELRATLVAGRQSVANVGGTILGLGEDIGGYRLEAVGEGTAVLRAGDKVLRLSVAPAHGEAGADD